LAGSSNGNDVEHLARLRAEYRDQNKASAVAGSLSDLLFAKWRVRRKGMRRDQPDLAATAVVWSRERDDPMRGGAVPIVSESEGGPRLERSSPPLCVRVEPFAPACSARCRYADEKRAAPRSKAS
jgi:hypothetical protein